METLLNFTVLNVRQHNILPYVSAAFKLIVFIKPEQKNRCSSCLINCVIQVISKVGGSQTDQQRALIHQRHGQTITTLSLPSDAARKTGVLPTADWTRVLQPIKRRRQNDNKRQKKDSVCQDRLVRLADRKVERARRSRATQYQHMRTARRRQCARM